MTETLADRIKDIAREIRWLGGDDSDTGRVAIFNTLYDIGQEAAALQAENERLREVLTDLLAWANIQDHHSNQAVSIRGRAWAALNRAPS